ncbi:MAG: glycosyltransferase family 4 protein [Bacteroidales bacterium]|nr:glycosyltransferase family 4 protein [Bacteroidales bacterium]
MKILFCDNALTSLLNFRSDVISYFLESGCEVVLVAPKIEKNRQMEKIVPAGCKVYTIEMEPASVNPLKDIAYFGRLLKIYRRESPDIVFHYTIKPNIYGTFAARLCRFKTVAMVAGLGYVFTGNSLLNKISCLLYKSMLLLSHKVISLNRRNYKLLLDRKFAKKKQMILFNGGEGVNLEQYSYKKSRFDSVTFLMVARILYDKGYNEYVEAARIVKNKYPDTKFKLLGPLDVVSPMGVPEEVVNKDVANGLIEYMGITNNVQAIMEHPNVVSVLPSYHEGLSRSLMEACAMGKPIITTNIPGCRETVDNEVNGFLVAVKKADSLAEAMIRFIELPKEKKLAMSKASHKKALKEFDVNNVLIQYRDIVDELLEKR